MLNLHFAYIHSAFAVLIYNSPNLFSVDRRNAVKKIAIASGSLITLPFWMTACTSDDNASTHLSSFSVQQQETLAAITDTIIPAGNATGALSVGIDKYLQKLIDKCFEKDVQDNVKAQLNGLETAAKNSYARSFTKCDQQERQELLLKLSTSEKKPEKDFFSLIKSETINGFTTSKEVMVNYFHYKTAPGHYYGCIPVKA